MARLSQGILGGVSGKIGNLVGSSWKGIAVIKTKALSVANPRTAAQVAQRGSMSSCVAFATSILATIIKPLNDRFAQGMSGFNLFVSRNVNFFTPTTLAFPLSLSLSRGKMIGIPPTSVVADKSLGTCVVNWATGLPDAYAQASDKVYIVVYNLTEGLFIVSSGSAIRSTGTFAAPLPFSWNVDDELYTYISFLRSDGSVVSDSGVRMDVVVA